MGVLDRIRKALAGSGSSGGDQTSYWIYARCRRCGEPLKARVDLRNEPSLADDGETYVVRKGLVGTGARRCFQVVEVTLHFDAQKARLIDSEASGGELISAEEYAALLEEPEEQVDAETDHSG